MDNHISDSNTGSMSEEENRRPKKKRIGKWLDIVIVLLFISGILWYQTRHLITPGEAMPPFELTIYNPQNPSENNLLHSDSLKGKQTVLVFWAPWCSVCEAEMSMINTLYKSKKDDINIYTITLDYGDLASVNKFITDTELKAPVLLGTNDTSRLFKINSFPTIYMLNKEGNVINHTVGLTTQIGVRARLALSELFGN